MYLHLYKFIAAIHGHWLVEVNATLAVIPKLANSQSIVSIVMGKAILSHST